MRTSDEMGDEMSDNQNTHHDIKWSYHQDRQAAIDEVHARPASDILAPAIVMHVAFTCSPESLKALFNDLIGEITDEVPRHAIGQVGNIETKIELHTEFTACTLIANNCADKSEIEQTYRRVLSAHNIKILSKCMVVVVSSAKELAKQIPFGKRVFGGMMRGSLQVQSTLKPDDWNTITYAVLPEKNGPNELGRRIQRLYELETYRIMALIGLPMARRISARLTELEDELNALTSLLENGNDIGDLTDQELFKKLSQLSGQLDSSISETRFRFSASNAYFDIVDARMKTLTEVEHGDLQSISGFLRSRLEPARATIISVEHRQKILTEDISRALTLLRTRIDIELSQGNQALLKSLDGRHRQQLLLSQAVEGLSSIAITYYAVSLLSYFLKPIDKSGALPFSYMYIIALAVPAVLFTVWFAIRRLRLKLHKSDN